MKNTRVQEFFSKKFRSLLSNEPSGKPPWLDVIAAGDTGGLFLPTDAPWVVHRDFGTLVGGIRALLVQAMHPGAVAGVTNHSRYQADALGRLAGTIRWLTVTTFGSDQAVANEAQRVNRLHKKVSGKFELGDGSHREYQAADQDLMLWVHVAFTESFLVCHQLYANKEIPGGEDAYVSQWAKSVKDLGLTNTPKNRAELDAVIEQYFTSGTLRVDKKTQEVIAFIRKPGLPWWTAGIYQLLFAAAVVSLSETERKLLNLKAGPKWLIVPWTRISLRLIRWIIGPESPIEQGALERLKRVGILSKN